jgi:hypothetical protein
VSRWQFAPARPTVDPVRIGRAARPPVHLITGAPKGITDDQAYRVRGYVISMSLRIVFFVSAVIAHGWLRWTLVLVAVFVPYFAVVFANGGREPTRDAPQLIGDATHQLPAAPPADT